MARGNKARKAASEAKAAKIDGAVKDSALTEKSEVVPLSPKDRLHESPKDENDHFEEAPTDFEEASQDYPEVKNSEQDVKQQAVDELPEADTPPADQPKLAPHGQETVPESVTASTISTGTSTSVFEGFDDQLDRSDYLQQLPPEEREIDLRSQVTSLNAKLVTSFNRIADLEDELSVSHNRILAHTTQIAELYKEREQHLFALNTGLLVEKSHVTAEMQRMMDRVLDETAQRGKAESDKTRIESELEELSASLFNEANKMVAVERLERARAEEKSAQFQQSLRDTERVLAEQQDMLKNLQIQIETRDKHEETKERPPTPDPTTILSLSSSDFSIYVQIPPYHEFIAFVKYLRALQRQLDPYIKLQQRGIDWTSDPTISQGVGMGGGIGGVVSPALSGQGSPIRHKDYPHLPASAEQLVQLSNQTSLPFIRRSQEEDSDPCLRFQAAPGLNWLSRRQASSAVLDGSMVIEPIFAGGIVHDQAKVRAEYGHLAPATCTMCGTALVNLTSLVNTNSPEPASIKDSGNRRSIPSLFQSLRRSVTQLERPGQDHRNDPSNSTTEEFFDTSRLPIPTHYFRVSESSSKYLVCTQYCLQRLRSVCAFWMFIRTLERAIVLEGKSSPDLVAGTSIYAAVPSINSMDESRSDAEGLQHNSVGQIDAVDAREVPENEFEIDDEQANEEEQISTKLPKSEEPAEQKLTRPVAEDHEATQNSNASKAQNDANIGHLEVPENSTDNENAQMSSEADITSANSEDGGSVGLDSVSSLKQAVPKLPSRPEAQTSSSQKRTVRKSFHPIADKADLSWEESLWTEIMRLKERMWKTRVGIDLET
ncbi:hypothetical protein MYAM1_000305 [Malassezia yamatoensis]|uniref:GDP/GTP exchange factor Sec2 N-terminal domain-containing protein n=1 Tax=Malassezia yamatoensis TaxID=253288 RepID=A0AAJ5YP27_9BASI|nr:hypothetical protein MYAM1_000305 [Malassezia yamatoensis]